MSTDAKRNIVIIKDNYFKRFYVLLFLIILTFSFVFIFLKNDFIDPREVLSKILYLLIVFISILSFPLGAFTMNRYFKEEPVKRKSLVRFLFVSSYILFSFFLIESVARIFPLHDSQPINPGVKHFWPDYNRKLNVLGFNDIENPLIKNNGGTTALRYLKNQVRIAVIGDSYTEGFGVTREKLFTRQLENLLNTKNSEKNYMIINMGQRGLNAKDEINLLKTQLMIIRPHIVITAFTLNDIEIPEERKDRNESSKKPDEKEFRKAGFFEYFIAKSLLGEGGSYAYYRYFYNKNFYSGSKYENELKKKYESTSREWQALQEVFQEISDLQNENNFKNILIVLPFFRDNASDYLSIHTKIVQEAEKKNIESYDFIKVFDKKMKLDSFAVSKIDSHPNEKAHKIIAQRLSQIILKKERF